MVPTVMESHGESWKVMEKKAVMEKSWKLKKINEVMETEKSWKKVMEKSWNLLGLPLWIDIVITHIVIKMIFTINKLQ